MVSMRSGRGAYGSAVVWQLRTKVAEGLQNSSREAMFATHGSSWMTGIHEDSARSLVRMACSTWHLMHYSVNSLYYHVKCLLNRYMAPHA